MRPTAHASERCKSSPRPMASGLVSEPDCGFREEPWRAGGGELAARRRTNVIRRDGSASKRTGTNLSKRSLSGVCCSIVYPPRMAFPGWAGSMVSDDN